MKAPKAQSGVQSRVSKRGADPEGGEGATSSCLASTAPLSSLEILVGLWYGFPLDLPQADGTLQFFLVVALF